MKHGKLWTAFGFILMMISLAGCGVEVARVPIQSTGEFSGVFQHDGAPITLWTDLDVEFIDDTQLWYEIKFSQSGDEVVTVLCDPFDVGYLVMSRRTHVRGVTKVSYLAPMKCSVNLPEAEITINARLYSVGEQVEIFRADLIVNERE